ncbi:recombinase family protein [Pseudomonas sp. FW305-70]|uniref:recombinase family protein n=1 Tax=Pseudomonas sp. FW305-70 TaxID=2751342 RepID=UPI000C88D77E|nr:recombinase family protein [Pseudomonas sp. FW305-70]PMZ76948.1 recombinase family protein [Pseudomonas sp. FW305-70]
MNNAYSYIRFSTGKQLKGSSLERQQAMLDEWAEDNPAYTLNRELTFKDLGISGRSGKHLKNGFGKLLEAVEQGDIGAGDVVLVEAIDRAGRMEPAMMLHILTGILLKGVTIITLDDKAVYTSESLQGGNVYILAGKVQAAFNYSEALSVRMKASYKSRNKLALEGTPPKRNTPVWLTSKGELRDEIKPFVVQAFEDFAAGLGERRIYERIMEKVRTLPNDEESDKVRAYFVRMAPSTVKRWMSNRTAIGEWQGIPEIYPRVVEPELFYRVQKRMEAKFAPRGAPTKHKYTGLVVCGECGKNFNTKAYGVRKKGVTPPAVMECSTRARRGSTACSNSKGIPESVIALVYSLSFSKGALRALQGQVLSASQKREVEIDGEVAELNKKIKIANKVILEFEDDDEHDDMIVTLRSLKARRKELLAEKEGLTESAVSVYDKIVDVTKFNLDPAKANAMLQSVGYRIVCNKDSTVVSESGTFKYEGWGRAEDVHKVVTPEGKLIKLPIHRLGVERKPSKSGSGTADKIKATLDGIAAKRVKITIK